MENNNQSPNSQVADQPAPAPQPQPYQGKANEAHQEMASLDTTPSSLSDKEIRDSYDHAIGHGLFDRATADKMLEVEHGLRPLELAPIKSTFEKNYDRDFAPADSADKYQVPKMTGVHEKYTAEVAERDAHFQKGLMAAQMPKNIGESYLEILRRANLKLSGMTDDAKKSWAIGQRNALIAHYGGQEKFDAKLSQVTKFIDEIGTKEPMFKQMIFGNLAATDAEAVNLLSQHIERMGLRQGSGT